MYMEPEVCVHIPATKRELKVDVKGIARSVATGGGLLPKDGFTTALVVAVVVG